MLWILNQTWSNGQIYLSGISADAISAYSDFIIPNPMINGGYMMWGSAYGHETSYWGGAYRYDLISHWLLTLDTCANAKNIEQQVRDNEAYTEWWAPIEANGPYGNHFPNVQAPGVTQAGWWDIFAQPQIDSYTGAYTYGSPKDKMWFWMIPLGHCTGDDLSDFGYPKFEIADPQIMSIQVFKGNWSHPIFSYTNRLNFYVFGPVPKYYGNVTYIGNYYTSLPDWPAYTATNYYLGDKQYLTTTAPTTSFNRTYTYDPKNPAPAIGANSLFSSSPCGPRDQAKQVENRADVLTWTSDALSAPLAITGKVTATISVASTAVDTDFMVSVTDVYPNGISSIVRYGAIRMKWRQDPTTPVLMTPGQIYTVTVDMWSTSYIWQQGHQIRVIVTSSRSPEFTVNPNNGYPLNDTSGPIIVAQNTIVQGPSTLSYITLPVVDLKDIPENPKIH